MLEKDDPYQLQEVERLISSFRSKVQPSLVVCSNMQQLISHCNSPPSGGRCSAGGQELPVSDGRGKEGLCWLLPYPVCAPAVPWLPVQGTWQSRAPSRPADCGKRNIYCSDV